LQSRNARHAAQVDQHPIRDQRGIGQDVSWDLLKVHHRLATLEQENEEFRVSMVTEISDLRRNLRLFRDKSKGWTLETSHHPVAREIKARFLSERLFIIDGIAKNMKLVFEAVQSPSD
jgi:hypothetical protein